jgi:hypothetical protein
MIGTPSANIKQLLISNEKEEGIYLRTGSRSGNTNLGQNKIYTNALGISFRRGGITSGDPQVTAGEIGAVDPLNGNFYINGTGTNSIYINSGLGQTVLDNNMLWVGSGTANANGRKSNIKMMDVNGTWEIQSSAFTEEIKTKLLGLVPNPKIYNNGTGKIEIAAFSFWWIGQAYNVTNLAASTHYQPSGYLGKKNVGELLYAFGYAHMFGSNGAYLLTDTPNLTFVFEMDFASNFSSVQALCSRVIVENSAGTALSETFFAGYRFNSERDTHNMNIYYHTAPLRHILNQGDRIYVATQHYIITPNSASIDTVKMSGKFSIHAN